MIVSFVVNGENVSVDVPQKTTLLVVLREYLGLMGTKKGCENGDCGACSVLVNGELKKSCVTLASRVEGCQVTTIEGIHDGNGGPNDLQAAFIEYGATQCGYCTPGMILTAEALLLKNQQPSRQEIRIAIKDNLCRCTGYQQIVDAIEAAARNRAKKGGHHE
ncbi:MAG: (2Fe-2S)-binding protein [Anaerolineales bacterium]|nr:(2Fe-2S)-binding protein [Anaerolineales bacterium]